MSLADVQFQANAHAHIQRAMSNDRLPHAYLFHGPDGVGKETFACGLAQLLLCNDPKEQPIDSHAPDTRDIPCMRVGCGECEDCRSVRAKTHPDLHLIYRQLCREHPDAVVRKRKAIDIGVDVLRHFVIEKVGRTPVRGRSKVFVMREADRITPQAQNALLKTLEEPPGNALLILLVTSLERLLPTTLSRCQIVRFDALPTTFVHETISNDHPDLPKEEVVWYAKYCAGSLGRAQNLIDSNVYELNTGVIWGLANSSSPAGKTIRFEPKAWIDESKSLSSTYRKKDPDISDTEAGRRALKSLMGLCSAWYADVVRSAHRSSSGIMNEGHRQAIEQVARRLPSERAIWAVNRLALAARQLDLNANTQLCIETLINDLKRLNSECVTACSPG